MLSDVSHSNTALSEWAVDQGGPYAIKIYSWFNRQEEPQAILMAPLHGSL